MEDRIVLKFIFLKLYRKFSFLEFHLIKSNSSDHFIWCSQTDNRSEKVNATPWLFFFFLFFNFFITPD